MNNKSLIEIRKDLHRNPELSNQEVQTSRKVMDVLQKFDPEQIISNIAGYGFAAVFQFAKPGKTIVFRAELDALPIKETNIFAHRSRNAMASHACGHDGHMTILIALAGLLQKHRKDFSGKVILLFQPAEETAEGAQRFLKDKRFWELKPDYIFALHNLPGYSLNKIILKKDVFASTSIGLKVRLLGETSHAGHPENGRSPVLAMLSILHDLLSMPQLFTPYEKSALITIIHARLGEEAFGTSPGEAEIMATFRAESDQILNIMRDKAAQMIKSAAEASNLDHYIKWVEYFPALVNDNDCVEFIHAAAENMALAYKFQNYPFAWTEDFSYFTQKIKGAFFGIGSGTDHPQLHNSNYDFPDELIEPAAKLFFLIVKEIQEKKI